MVLKRKLFWKWVWSGLMGPQNWSLLHFSGLWLLEHFVPEKLVVIFENQLNFQ